MHGTRVLIRSSIVAVFAVVLVLQSTELVAADPAQPSPNPYAQLIPQNLLRLIHAPEVHQELGMSEQQVAELERFLPRIDGPWFRSRILEAEKRQRVVAELEQKLWQWLGAHTTQEQRQRLRQIEYRSLGPRMLLRPELSQFIGMTDQQIEQFAELAKAADSAVLAFQQAQMRGNDEAEQLRDAAVQAAEKEQQSVRQLLQPEQLQKLSSRIGEPFDTAKLERIYPLAPELVAVENWINSQPLTLRGLRGKVVIVHYYAFQCHNCHANFEHYKRWHENFPTDEVVVLGIQTPETQREHDPAAVREAAKERGLKFPILVDLESKNWKTWANTMWPTVYVIDQRGYIRYIWQGELNWSGATQDEVIEQLVQKLLDEAEAISPSTAG